MFLEYKVPNNNNSNSKNSDLDNNDINKPNECKNNNKENNDNSENGKNGYNKSSNFSNDDINESFILPKYYLSIIFSSLSPLKDMGTNKVDFYLDKLVKADKKPSISKLAK